MAVVKANAYGHGAVAVAQTLSDADAFGVARIEEAVALRAAGIQRPILLMEGVVRAEQLAEAARHGLQLVVHEPGQLALLESAPAGQRFVVWLKFDSGMNRLGFRAPEFEAALLRLTALGGRIAEVRLMTHFAAADEPDGGHEQLARFAQLAAGRGNLRSLANSAAVFALPASHADWVRPGLALYGVSPFADRDGAALGLVPAMRLVSTVIALREVPAGEAVGYGATWRARHDTRVAILAAGYADGLMRSLPSGTPVLVNGVRAGLLGRVSMDMIAVDVTQVPDVHVGGDAVLWGPELPVEEIASRAGTNGYELLCAVSARVSLVLA